MCIRDSIKSVPDVSGFVAFGDWALAGKQTLEILKLNGIGSILNYEYIVKNNNTNDMYNYVEMICTKIGTGKEFNSVELRLTVSNLKMILEKNQEDLQISVIDKKGI